MLNFDEAAKTGNQTIDMALKSYADAARGVQAIAAETADFSRNSFEQAVSHVGTLSAAGSMEVAFELQARFAKTCCDNLMVEAARLGGLYAGLAKAVYAPYAAQAPGADTAA